MKYYLKYYLKYICVRADAPPPPPPPLKYHLKYICVRAEARISVPLAPCLSSMGKYSTCSTFVQWEGRWGWEDGENAGDYPDACMVEGERRGETVRGGASWQYGTLIAYSTAMTPFWQYDPFLIAQM